MANRQQLYEYKGDCCAHCGLTVKEMVERYGDINRMFEFNYVDPSQKHPDYDNLIQRVISSNQLDEVDKCILLCRQCHGILHAQSITGSLEVTVNVAGTQTTQTFRGQVIADKKDRRARFLTNERVLVVPYRLRILGRQPQLYFGTELEKEGILCTHLKALPQIKKLMVLAYQDSHVWMSAEHIEGNRIKMQVDVRFPVLTLELCRDCKEDPVVWVRNGVALTKEGEVIHNGTVTYEALLGND
jgi:hypothetical protein